MERFVLELEFDLTEDQSYWVVGALLAFVCVLFGLGVIGHPATPYTDAGLARPLTWTDWQLKKAEKVYLSEVVELRRDAESLAGALNSAPNPVQIQLLTDRVLRSAASGTPALELARYALSQASLAVRSWSVGSLARDEAIQSLEAAVSLLQ